MGQSCGGCATGGTYDDVVALELEGIALHAFLTESLAIYKGPVTALDIFNVYLDVAVSESKPAAEQRRTFPPSSQISAWARLSTFESK